MLMDMNSKIQSLFGLSPKRQSW